MTELPEIARAMLACPYYRSRQDGTCTSGCRDEPECITDRPLGGWEAWARLAPDPHDRDDAHEDVEPGAAS